MGVLYDPAVQVTEGGGFPVVTPQLVRRWHCSWLAAHANKQILAVRYGYGGGGDVVVAGSDDAFSSSFVSCFFLPLGFLSFFFLSSYYTNYSYPSLATDEHNGPSAKNSTGVTGGTVTKIKIKWKLYHHHHHHHQQTNLPASPLVKSHK